jgi:hypothetical protein
MTCEECERLSALYADLVAKNAELLTRYLEAISRGDEDTQNHAASALEAGLVATRRREQNLSTHLRAAHDGRTWQAGASAQ